MVKLTDLKLVRHHAPAMAAAICLLVSGQAVAVQKNLPAATAQISPAAASSLPLKVGLERAAFETLAIGDTAKIDLPGLGVVDVVATATEKLASGNIALRGYLPQWGSPYGADLVIAPTGIVGDIRTPAGRYHIEPSRDAGQVATFYSAGSPVMDKCAADQNAATTVAATPATSSKLYTQLVAGLATRDIARIDVMFVYTPAVEASFGTGLQARLESLVLAANSATANSAVDIRFSLAGAMKVSPRKLVVGDLGATLQAITSSEDRSLPANDDFYAVAAKRAAMGADIVVLLVSRADYSVGCDSPGKCIVGTAWQATQQSLAASNPNLRGYAAVDISASDLSLAVTHEIGHLLGAGHDYASGGEGLFPDSKAFRSADGLRGTLMSYAPQPVMLFSNPDVLCNGAACGAASTEDAPADNARALNASRFIVAGYKESAAPDVAGLWANPQPPGQRVHLSRRGNTMTALLFMYNTAGKPAWYVANGCQIHAGKCSSDLYMSWTMQSGITGGMPLDPMQVMGVKVGTLDLDVNNANAPIMTYTVYSESTEIGLARQLPATAASAQARDGIWWMSTGLESGIAAARNGASLLLTWFTYGDNGRSTWFVVPDCRLDAKGSACEGDLFQGAALDNVSKAGTQKVGMANLEFAGPYAGTFRWNLGQGWQAAGIERELTIE
jgi:hypothetical protein